ncbi:MULTISPECIES: DUF7230 family protein [Methylomonas]|uniref:DUF7230 family protein n=1 Tax=Methylomonas TaxID=416 RepID=UPI0012325C88|nr:hypothetical protein [Methylomonas rhizoryzae]
MKKQRKAKLGGASPVNNPVAKFAGRFNKAQIFADKRQYRRKAKHPGAEPFAIVSAEAIAKGSAATRSTGAAL